MPLLCYLLPCVVTVSLKKSSVRFTKGPSDAVLNLPTEEAGGHLVQGRCLVKEGSHSLRTPWVRKPYFSHHSNWQHWHPVCKARNLGLIPDPSPSLSHTSTTKVLCKDLHFSPCPCPTRYKPPADQPATGAPCFPSGPPSS